MRSLAVTSAGSLDRHGHRLEPALGQRLGREDVLDLAGADASQGAERAVGRGVGVAADDHEPGLRQAHLRPDDVDYALPQAPTGGAGCRTPRSCS